MTASEGGFTTNYRQAQAVARVERSEIREAHKWMVQPGLRCAPSGLRTLQRVRNTTHDGVMVSFTAATSWLSVNGFGRNANC
jgi:hypothetical protein